MVSSEAEEHTKQYLIDKTKRLIKLCKGKEPDLNKMDIPSLIRFVRGLNAYLERK